MFSSYYNVDLERTFATFQSAIFGGQTKGARQLFGVEVAYQTLDQILKTNDALKQYGVTAKQLTQDQKALLRSIQFLVAGQNAFGDMEKTINSTANQIRVFEGALSNLKLALGDMVLTEPFQKMLTYINGIIIGLTDIIRAFTPINKEVSFANQITQVGELNEELEKTKGNLLSFDKFEALNSTETTGVGNIEITQALTEELRKQQELYDSITKSMTTAGNKATEIAKQIRDWFIEVDIDGKFVGWTDKAKALGIAITAIFSINVLSSAYNFFATIQKNMGILDSLKFAILECATSTAGLTTQTTLLGKAFTFIQTHPIVLAITAIVAILVILYKKNENFRKSIDKLFDTLSNLLTTALQPIFDIIEALSPLFDVVFEALGLVLTPIIDNINAMLTSTSGIIEMIVSVVRIALLPISSAIKSISALIEAFIALLSGDLGGALDILSNRFSEVWYNMANGFASAINGIVNGFVKFVNGIVDGLNIILKPLDELAGLFGGNVEIPHWDFQLNWQPYPQYKANGGIIDTRGGDALAIVNEYGSNELVYSNNARQVEVSNQQSLEQSFLSALLKYHNITADDKAKISVEIEDKSSFAEFTRKITPNVLKEGRRIGML